MFDCFGYEKGCEICARPLTSGEACLVRGELLCKTCDKAVKDAREQQLYLKRLRAGS